jgi:high affinity Mn2+ porin
MIGKRAGWRWTLCGWVGAASLLVAMAVTAARGQDSSPPDQPQNERWSVHFQATSIGDAHDSFAALYSGPASLDPHSEVKGSITSTFFLGLNVRKGLEIYVDPEISGGAGFSHVNGLAGFPNGEITRVTSPTPKAYIARAFVRQTWALGDAVEHLEGDANQLAGNQPVSRLTLTFGKMSVTDIFDTNAYSHDPRGQFMNWALMDNGAFDYPADTRGYTWGAALDLNQRRWAVRVGSFLVSTYANGLPLDRHFRTNNGEVGEVELHPKLLGQHGKVKFLGYVNQANMGTYRLALQEMPVDPDVTLTRRSGTVKYGFGLNAEQPLTPNLGAFLRWGWNDGKTESWEFTEIDRTGQAGLQWMGKRWRRPKDAAGVAGVINGLSQDHRQYLAAGGHGFIIGDGHLDYASERLLEAYYAWKAVKFTTLTLNYQFAANPAYNRDRGPVSILSMRIHFEF